MNLTTITARGKQERAIIKMIIFNHFSAGLTGSGGAVNGKPCSKCGKSCVNSDRLQERDQRRVRELRERNGINL